MALAINFATINVNSLQRASSITVGEVNQGGWSSHYKSNYGNGQYVGENFMVNVAAGISDIDAVDDPIMDVDYVPNAQNQQA